MRVVCFLFFFLLPADMDVAYLQLLLFVWHSFTVETRKALLIQCAHTVMKAAQARE